jgi:hypothetical protein
VDLYFVRFVEITNAIALFSVARVFDVYDMLGHRLQSPRLETGLNNAVPFLPAVPFLVAFLIVLRKEPTASQWLAIRAIHQALAIVTLAISALSIVGLPDTAPALIYVGVLAVLQLAALKATRQFVSNPSHVRQWPIPVLRVAMVLLFTFAFLMRK